MSLSLLFFLPVSYIHTYMHTYTHAPHSHSLSVIQINISCELIYLINISSEVSKQGKHDFLVGMSVGIF